MEVRRPTHLTDDGEAVWTGFGIDGLVVTCPTDAEGFRDDDPVAQIRDLDESVAWFASALADSMRKEGESWIANLRLGTQLAAAIERADVAEAALAARDADGPVVPLAEVKALIARLADACAEADRLGDRCAVLEGQVSELLSLAVIGVDESCGGEEYRAFVARVHDGEFGEVQS